MYVLLIFDSGKKIHLVQLTNRDKKEIQEINLISLKISPLENLRIPIINLIEEIYLDLLRLIFLIIGAR